ncbi:MAG: hypothetical protein O3B01_26795 [Planctomycetota bacterium]|nr:hypothetical protein [Planctomycetota bacterium]MDA1142186.1 hypothetical protein [Planctomycetota bacterium]
MRHFAWLATVALLAHSTAAYSSQTKKSERRRPLNGDVAQKNLDRLTTEIHWERSLSEALDLAKREGKMVFWMHMLGDLEGMT